MNDFDHTSLPIPSPKSTDRTLSVHELESLTEEEIWLAGQLSEQTREAYRKDVRAFVQAMRLKSINELRRVGRATIVGWVNSMHQNEVSPRTIRRRLSSLSSLFAHLVSRQVMDANPVRDVKCPRVNRRQGTTKAFGVKEARKLLDAPDSSTLIGLRDRAILSVGLQAGPRRAEIASLKVKDYHVNAGYKSLHLIRKGGVDLSLSINPQTAQRIDDYLAAAGHGDDLDGPLFRPLKSNQIRNDSRRPIDPTTVDRLLRRYAGKIGLSHGYSAHSMRATFITTALNNGAALEDVQRDVGHADPSTTKLYDRRGHNTEKSAAFFATY